MPRPSSRRHGSRRSGGAGAGRDLFHQLDGGEFDLNKGDFGVRLREGWGESSVLLSDVLVDAQHGSGKEHATKTPIVVVEVLSPNTDLAHHVDELGRYAERPSLIH